MASVEIKRTQYPFTYSSPLRCQGWKGIGEIYPSAAGEGLRYGAGSDLEPPGECGGRAGRRRHAVRPSIMLWIMKKLLKKERDERSCMDDIRTCVELDSSGSRFALSENSISSGSENMPTRKSAGRHKMAEAWIAATEVRLRLGLASSR